MGIHFPNPLQGFSVNASREQMATLPQGFILSGMDTSVAMVMYPDILARDWNTFGLDLAALSFYFQYSRYSLKFTANDVNLEFDNTHNLVNARAD